jgi:hypothetical protein
MRRPIVALTLADLHGPVSGVVKPPRRIWWSGTPCVDLGNLGEVAVFYESVLDVGSPEDQAEWLNAGLLTKLWPSLGMRAGQRETWESLNPQQLGEAEVPAA